ncbi:hypothetical protein KY331_06060 [Candidatus Woesearchaeota archaeon]|nr:hypothetical protein [Candidatus Woesearchaeota archaeon]
MQDFDPKKYTTKDLYDVYTSDHVRQALLATGIDEGAIDDFGDSDRIDNTSLEFRILEAAELFNEKGFHNFSGTLLNMLLYSQTWCPDEARSYKTRTIHRLSSMFRDEAKYKSGVYDMSVSCIQILRETSGSYSGNLYEARNHWKRFVPSESDFRNSIRLPTPIPNQEGMRLPEEAAFVIGAIYAAGYMANSGETRHPCRLFVRGDKNDVFFYDEVLKLSVQLTFNVSDIYSAEERPTRDRTSTYGLPTLRIDSLAVGTWLCYDLGFPRMRTRNANKKFPGVCLGDHNYLSLLSGFVSAKGTKHKKRGSMRFISRDVNFLSQISEQLQRAGIPISRVYESRAPFIEVSKQNLPKLISKLNITNVKLL